MKGRDEGRENKRGGKRGRETGGGGGRKGGLRGGRNRKKKTILPDLHLNHSRSCHGDADSSSSRCLTFLWPLPSNQGKARAGTAEER